MQKRGGRNRCRQENTQNSPRLRGGQATLTVPDSIVDHLVEFIRMYEESPRLRDTLQHFTQENWYAFAQSTKAGTIDILFDLIRYGMIEEIVPAAWKPQILTDEETLTMLTEHPQSFARFGDGEFAILQGESIPFQHADDRLAAILKAALASDGTSCAIGLSDYYHLPQNANQYAWHWFVQSTMPLRAFVDACANRNHPYISANFTVPYISMKAVDVAAMDQRYERILNLFTGRDVVIFAGDRVFTKLEYNVFERARSIEVVQCPSKHAFDRYDDILRVAREYPETTTLCFILGPTATAAAYELSLEGRLAWDIGHMAKDYDAYRRRLPRTGDATIDFFRPD